MEEDRGSSMKTEFATSIGKSSLLRLSRLNQSLGFVLTLITVCSRTLKSNMVWLSTVKRSFSCAVFGRFRCTLSVAVFVLRSAGCRRDYDLQQ